VAIKLEKTSEVEDCWEDAPDQSPSEEHRGTCTSKAFSSHPHEQREFKDVKVLQEIDESQNDWGDAPLHSGSEAFPETLAHMENFRNFDELQNDCGDELVQLPRNEWHHTPDNVDQGNVAIKLEKTSEVEDCWEDAPDQSPSEEHRGTCTSKAFSLTAEEEEVKNRPVLATTPGVSTQLPRNVEEFSKIKSASMNWTAWPTLHDRLQQNKFGGQAVEQKVTDAPLSPEWFREHWVKLRQPDHDRPSTATQSEALTSRSIAQMLCGEAFHDKLRTIRMGSAASPSHMVESSLRGASEIKDTEQVQRNACSTIVAHIPEVQVMSPMNLQPCVLPVAMPPPLTTVPPAFGLPPPPDFDPPEAPVERERLRVVNLGCTLWSPEAHDVADFSAWPKFQPHLNGAGLRRGIY